jgi:hypothetical protein
MLIAYSGCIAQIKHYSLAGARTRDLAERTYVLAQEFKGIGCRLCWLCIKGFPERWIIILPSIRHIDPKTSVKLQSEASCPESKAAMTTMVVDQSENSSPVKSPLKMWRLSD